MAQHDPTSNPRLTTLEEIITGLQGSLTDDQEIVAVVNHLMRKGRLRRPRSQAARLTRAA